MRRKSARNAQKATPDKPVKEPEPAPKTRRSRRRKRSPSHSSGSEEEVITVTKRAPLEETPDTTTKSHTPSDEDNVSEEPMWKVTTTDDSPKGEIQKLKICLTRPSPDSPEKCKTRRSKSNSQTEEDATSSEDKGTRRTRSQGSPMILRDGLSSHDVEDVEEKKGKGKSKGKHKSKVEKSSHLHEPESQTNNEISENAQVTPQSPSIDNENAYKVDDNIQNVCEQPEAQDNVQSKDSDDDQPLSIIQKKDSKETEKTDDVAPPQETTNLPEAAPEESFSSDVEMKSVDNSTANIETVESTQQTETSELPQEQSNEEPKVSEDNAKEPTESPKEEQVSSEPVEENKEISSEQPNEPAENTAKTEEVSVEKPPEETVEIKKDPEEKPPEETVEINEDSEEKQLPTESSHDTEEKKESVDEESKEVAETKKSLPTEKSSTDEEKIEKVRTPRFILKRDTVYKAAEEQQNDQPKLTPSAIQRKWTRADGPSWTKVDLESIRSAIPEISFPEEPDLHLDVEKERRKSSDSLKKFERKVSVEYKSDTERPSFETQTSVTSSTNGDDSANIIAFNRKISIVDDTASKLKPPPSPAKNPITEILFITNLVRPFTVKQLRELLERTGKIVEGGFWTDRIKSKCYVQYETQEEAEATRNAIHGVQWPIGNGKKLIIDYATSEEMENAKNPPAPPVPVAVPETNKTPKENEPVEDKWPEKTAKEEVEKRPEAPVREWDIGKKDIRRERSRSRDRGRKHKRSPTPSDDFIARKQRKEEESVPQKLMDDLFLKTKATPSIYWQPLSPEEISMKQQQRLMRMEEHKRRMEENSRMRGGREMGGRGGFRRRYD